MREKEFTLIVRDSEGNIYDATNAYGCFECIPVIAARRLSDCVAAARDDEEAEQFIPVLCEIWRNHNGTAMTLYAKVINVGVRP